MEATRNDKLGTVRDWMSRNLVTVEPECALGEVLRLMIAQGVRHALVTERESVVGIFSFRDLSRLVVHSTHTDAASISVTRVMTEGPVTASPDTPLTDAAQVMLDRKIGTLPVVEEDRLIGILTRSDVLEALLRWAEKGAEPAIVER